MMKFRMRKRKRAATLKDVDEKPPGVITVAVTNEQRYDKANESRWALQKVFASHLQMISRQHLNDRNRHALDNTKASLADASATSDTSTKDKAVEEPVVVPTADAPPKNQSFQFTCGGGRGGDEEVTLGSLMETRVIVEQNIPVAQRESEMPKKRLKCMSIPTSLLECTSPLNDSSTEPPQSFPQCFSFSKGCITSLFPDSYNHHDLQPGEAAELARNGVSETQRKIVDFFQSANVFFKKQPALKRNGIPKYITFSIPCKNAPVGESKCCGAIPSSVKGQPVMKEDPVETVSSFDTSLLRLEESLKKANLDADVEEQHTWPMHEPRPDDLCRQDQTAENTSATSSISTHSSLKFGKSIVKLPLVLAPPL